MATQLHNSSLLDLEPDTIIELYELDLGEEDGLYRFHAGKNDIKDIRCRWRLRTLRCVVMASYRGLN